jgi:hypothetical protein
LNLGEGGQAAALAIFTIVKGSEIQWHKSCRLKPTMDLCLLEPLGSSDEMEDAEKIFDGR